MSTSPSTSSGSIDASTHGAASASSPGRRRVPPRRGVAAAVAAGLALVLALPSPALGAPGDPDPAFDGDGRVATDFGGGGYDESRGMVIQPDGKIVTVGLTVPAAGGYSDFALARYNTDGSLDPTFNGDGDNDGRITTDLRGGDDTADAVAVQPDGKLVVAGYSADPDGGGGAFTVARFHANGSLDTTFDGSGFTVTDFGTGGPQEAHAVVIQPGGAIVAAGGSGTEVAVARYNAADGSPDSTFGDGGKVTTGFAGGSATAFDVTLQADNKIVIAGRSGYNYPSNESDFALARYQPNGSLDTAFGDGGRVTTPFAGADVANGVKVQPDGKIVTAGNSGFDFALARYNPADGSLDGTFDGDGKVTTDFGTNTLDGAADLALQSDGRIVAAGISLADFGVARYNTDGSLDNGFGTGGKVHTDVSFGYFDTANAVALQSDGKIVVSGNTGDDRGLVRYQVTTPPPPPGVDLAVTKTGPGSVSIGDQATYTVTVTNTSTTATATGVTLADTLTGPGTLLSATPAQGSCTLSATTANCTLGTLAPGARTTVRFTAEPRATGTLSDRATASAAQPDPATANNTATAATSVNNARGCTIIGTSGTDTLTGGFGNDVICALSGNDTVRAGYGNDTVHAGPGNDDVDGGFGNDILVGGPGNDTLTGSYGDDRLDTVDGVSGNDSANGGFNTDTCTTDPGDTRISCP
ncbi:calcium-binding protein [Streptomyces katrae]|uniref:Calcium-binding protein n=1 Tax=Streptomyces katrae TaxID=68223 RepID=A0ABT7GPC7_9ACTN|nr:calcium-binding protein [Streptomyces katrae]MDK9495164.1 calcium-binding protein [Streptomyces katrae]